MVGVVIKAKEGVSLYIFVAAWFDILSILGPMLSLLRYEHAISVYQYFCILSLKSPRGSKYMYMPMYNRTSKMKPILIWILQLA